MLKIIFVNIRKSWATIDINTSLYLHILIHYIVVTTHTSRIRAET